MKHKQVIIKAAPFLRWAGGKSRIVHLLKGFVPPQSAYNRYVEPFLGSGALFFSVQPQSAILADLNAELINCYKQVALHPREVWHLLQRHWKQTSRKYYNQVRALAFTEGTALERAALFIYINKAAFNGIYRVNKDGKFNVPYGTSNWGLSIPREDAIVNAGRLLKKSKIIAGRFEETCELAERGDFVYLDPPYPPYGKTAYFTQYTSAGFGMEDHKRVAKIFKELDRKGCLVMLSNSDKKGIRELFDGYQMKRLHVTRWLGSNGDRFKVYELVITNYCPKP